MDAEKKKFDDLLASVQTGGVHFVTGKNGSGKSRFFSYATKENAHVQFDPSERKGRLLCLSGTMHDKYSASIYRSKNFSGRTVYLGNKVNNNMVSDVAPFRVLCVFLLRKLHEDNGKQSQTKERVADALRRLKFENEINLKFRFGKGRKTEVIEIIEPDLTCDLVETDLQNSHSIRDYSAHIENGDITLSDVRFKRDGQLYGLAELSSGEKQYALALLGLIYCGNTNCDVYYDEPENSLHPSWQLAIISDLVGASETLFPNTTFLIATHSPLIASSIRNARTFTCNFPAGQSWTRSDLYGKPSDSVLRDQFHLYSSRPPEVYTVLNICLDLIARNRVESDEFAESRARLSDFDLQLGEDDPLYDVVTTILSFPANGEN